MKKISLVLILMGLLIASCEGPSGPPGPQGPSGVSGTNILGQTYEYTASFTTANNFSYLINLPVTIYNSDVILAYIQWDLASSGNPIWRPLPQTIMFNNGDQLIYQYDFTKNSIQLFLDSNFNLNTLESSFATNQKFRFVVVPSDFANKLSKNPSYEEVTQALKIKEVDFKKP
jgi:hypothetical protein